MRQQIVQFVRNINSTSEFYQLVSESRQDYILAIGSDWIRRLNYISTNNAWFDHQFMQLTAWFLKRDIICYTTTGDVKVCGRGANDEHNPCVCLSAPLHVANIGDAHYQSLLPIGLHRDDSRGKDIPVASDNRSEISAPLTYQCPSCEKSFLRPQFLNRHIKTDHKDMETCDECGEMLPNIVSLLKHIESVHISPDVTCPVCDKSFKSENEVKQHLQDFHKEGKKSKSVGQDESSEPKKKSAKGNFQCQSCSKSFVQKQSLTRHVKSVHDKVLHSCDQCGKTFTQKDHLGRHISEIHCVEQRFNCPHCNEYFTRNDNLTRHVLDLHENIRNYKCGECLQSFSQKATLLRHINDVHKSN